MTQNDENLRDEKIILTMKEKENKEMRHCFSDTREKRIQTRDVNIKKR